MPERPDGYHGDETALYGTRDETDMQHWGREKDSGAGRMPVTHPLPASGDVLSSDPMKQMAREQACNACRAL